MLSCGNLVRLAPTLLTDLALTTPLNGALFGLSHSEEARLSLVLTPPGCRRPAPKPPTPCCRSSPSCRRRRSSRCIRYSFLVEGAFQVPSGFLGPPPRLACWPRDALKFGTTVRPRRIRRRTGGPELTGLVEVGLAEDDLAAGAEPPLQQLQLVGLVLRRRSSRRCGGRDVRRSAPRGGGGGAGSEATGGLAGCGLQEGQAAPAEARRSGDGDGAGRRSRSSHLSCS